MRGSEPLSPIPRVSIGLPVFNGARYLAEALDALLAQTERDFELIVSDNASTDETPAIVRSYAQRDERIRYLRQASNIGGLANFKFVLEEARGEYFMWAAADDLWAPTFVERLTRELDAHPERHVAMCAVERFRASGERQDTVRWGRRDDPSRLGRFRVAMRLASGAPYHLYIYGMYRRPFLVEGFTRVPDMIAVDRVFVCQAALASRFVYVDMVLHRRRLNEESIVVRYANDSFGQVWRDPWRDARQVVLATRLLLASRVIPPRFRWAAVPVVGMFAWRAAIRTAHRFVGLVRALSRREWRTARASRGSRGGP